jgi:Lipoprotein LpqB beta-propeller domain/Sporulation and spore germination
VTRRAALLLVILCALALSGCVRLPQTGPVRTVPAPNAAQADALVDFTPGGPKAGSAPVPLVDNFLSAMTATPLSTFVAREFLTSESSRSWVPERGTIAYGSHRLVSKPGGRVVLVLGDVVALDDRGTWLGDPTGGRGLRYDLRLVREDGEWRITRPPNRLLIPRTHFDTEYQPYMLYFFDKSAQVLVPEPVYVPRGLQAPTLLVAGLLKGPARGLDGVERTFFPAGTSLDGISVPVSRDGTAEIPLSDAVLDVDDQQLNLLFAQLAWTLGQIAGVERIRVTVGGTPVDIGGTPVDVRVGSWSEFDPAVAWASTTLFGIRDGRVVAVANGKEEPVGGRFGTVPLGLRSIGVDLPAQHVAGVTSDGTRVLESAMNSTRRQSQVRTVYAGTDVLRPVYDLYGQAWVLDRTVSGARVAVVRDGVPSVVPVAGLSGRAVVRMVLSRDGTRLVAQLRENGRDALVLSRVERDNRGRVLRVSPATPLPLPGEEGAVIRGLAWRTPSSLAVLVNPSAGASQLLAVKVDGSAAPEEVNANSEVFRDNALQLVTSPAVGAPLYIGTANGHLFSLASTGRWTGTNIRPGLVAPVFVG